MFSGELKFYKGEKGDKQHEGIDILKNEFQNSNITAAVRMQKVTHIINSKSANISREFWNGDIVLPPLEYPYISNTEISRPVRFFPLQLSGGIKFFLLNVQ